VAAEARHFRPRFPQVAVTGLILSALVYAATGFSWQAALVIGLPLALSSTAQVLPSLRSDGSVNTPAGERAFSVLLFQDLSIVPLITIVAALSRAPPDPSAPPGWQMALYTIGAIAGLIIAGASSSIPCSASSAGSASASCSWSQVSSPCWPAPQ
jgi:CPA2 family monovalent cation:H+ antiporter-2